MGGRSATSGILTFGRKMGTRLTPKQYKAAVSDHADFIYRELQRTPAVQKIIRKSFRGNTAIVTFDISGGGIETGPRFITDLNLLTGVFENRIREQQKLKKDTNQWSAYDVARAKMQALKQTLDEIEKLKKKVERKS